MVISKSVPLQVTLCQTVSLITHVVSVRHCERKTKQSGPIYIAIPYKNFAFLCLLSAKQRFVVKKTTFFESKNHLFLMKKGGFFIIETKSGRNQKPFGRIIIENGLLRFSLAMREFLRLARNKVASHDNRWKLAVTKKEGS